VYRSLADANRDAEEQEKTLSQIALERESEDQGRPIEEIRASLSRALAVMRGAIGDGMTGELRSSSGLVGGDAAKLFNDSRGPLADTPFRDILARGRGRNSSRGFDGSGQSEGHP
jgi:L-serine dehydratase